MDQVSMTSQLGNKHFLQLHTYNAKDPFYVGGGGGIQTPPQPL